MSEGTKPLIFVEPLSETLKKLKEVMEENAEHEGIEIFEVDALEEAAQLIPTLGQSLILVTSPKKCAMMLQQNKRQIKDLQTKTILLSPKTIPRKTLDKFMKVGLTECVVEPVNPKTLLYKVRLQLRSIATQKPEDEDEELNSRVSDSGESYGAEEGETKLRAEKGVILDEEEEPTPTKERLEREETTLEDYREPKKRTYQEEVIESYYKGKNKRKDQDGGYEEEKKEKKEYQEEAIEAHYKGNLKKEELFEEQEEVSKKKPIPHAIEEDVEIEGLKKKLNLEIEQDLATKRRQEVESFEEEKKKKKTPQALDIEEEDEEIDLLEKEGPEDLGGHYKGKINKGLYVEEDKDLLDEKGQDELEQETVNRKKSPSLQVEEEEENYRDFQNEEQETAPTSNKKRPSLEVADDRKDDLLEKGEKEKALEFKKRSSLEVLEEKKKEEKKRPPEEQIENASNHHDNRADEIDSYLRGGAAKKELSVSDEEEDLYRDEEKEQETLEKKKEKARLELQEEEIEKDPLLGDKEYPEEQFKKKKTEMDIHEEDDLKKRETSEKEYEETKERGKSSYKEEDQEGHTRGKGSQKQEKDIRHGNRANARADKIKTHYSSKEGIQHRNDNWDTKWEKKQKPNEEFPDKNQDEKSLIIENEDLGEQTIDYGQLKKEFDAISIDGVPNKKKEYGSFDNIAHVKTFTKKVPSPEGPLEEMTFEEIQEEELEEEGHQVYEPLSLGMEIAIQVQNFYFEKDVDSILISDFMNTKISEEFKGHVVFYSEAQSDSGTPLFNGYVREQTGAPPEKPKEEELEALSRVERKELEEDYQEDLNDYHSKKAEAEKEFEDKYGDKYTQWKEYKTPSWKDHTFQEETNEFVFPFYEGITLLGLAVFLPKETFNPERSDALEAVFEVARGIFLTQYHETSGEGKIREGKKKEEEDKKEKKGFLKGLFKKTG